MTARKAPTEPAPGDAEEREREQAIEVLHEVEGIEPTAEQIAAFVQRREELDALTSERATAPVVPDLAQLVASQLSGFALSDECWLVIDASPDEHGGCHVVATVYAPFQDPAQEEVVEFELAITRHAPVVQP